MSEEIVSGGQNRVFIRGGFVYRPSHPWSEGTRRLLDFCHAEGLEFVPEWHGRDKDGNEIFEYIEGEVGNYPLPKFLRNITAVVTAGRTLRRFHDATAKLIGDDALRLQRLRAFFDAYGASREQMIAAVEILPRRLLSLLDWMYREAAAGNEGCKQNLRDRHHELYLRDVLSLTTLHEKL